jgi:lipopolysaccharide transport system ATP-binding protein
MSVVIRVENLSKQYQLRHQKQQSYVSLRDVIANKVADGWKGIREIGKAKNVSADLTRETFWALKDINLEFEQGDRIGIIGRNGAGKSTLLKLLSRITEPTRGKISINGRISSLLEVGTGFHPELSGRENVYLNGAILGMRHQEIKQKFDEIVAFADVEKFLDTPVKHYSSGMYMRLAFSVAAHLDPEILVIDEVLAVGDAAFQKKCLGKMKEVGEQGRTVLFVSHSMPTVTSLCNKCVLLDKGQVATIASPSEAIMYYYTEGGHTPSFIDFSSRGENIGDEYVRLLGASVEDVDGNFISEADIRYPVKICMQFRVLKDSDIPFIPNFHFLTASGVYAFVSSQPPSILKTGDYKAECIIPGDFLNEGTYFVGLAISSSTNGIVVHYFQENAINFNVKDSMEGTVGRHGYVNVFPGVVRPRLNWKIQSI